MPERAEPILKVLCVLLAGVLVLEIARVIVRHNPVGRLAVPELPTLPAKTNATAEAKTTNAAGAKLGAKRETNGVAGKTSTNSTPEAVAKTKDTNAVSAAGTENRGTNVATNALAETAKTASNSIASVEEKNGTNKLSDADFGAMKTNGVTAATTAPKDTNAASAQVSAKSATNAAPEKPAKGRRPSPFMPGQMGGEKLADLPPLIQARIDKIIESEILAQLTKPQPAGLLGVAGRGAMLRSSSGQTGYVKEGGELGGLKLLQVGVNRVLVTEDGKTNELTIFSGIGGETLLPKQGGNQ
jgi:hypothetical protein